MAIYFYTQETRRQDHNNLVKNHNLYIHRKSRDSGYASNTLTIIVEFPITVCCYYNALCVLLKIASKITLRLFGYTLFTLSNDLHQSLTMFFLDFRSIRPV